MLSAVENSLNSWTNTTWAQESMTQKILSKSTMALWTDASISMNSVSLFFLRQTQICVISLQQGVSHHTLEHPLHYHTKLYPSLLVYLIRRCSFKDNALSLKGSLLDALISLKWEPSMLLLVGSIPLACRIWSFTLKGMASIQDEKTLKPSLEEWITMQIDRSLMMNSVS